MRSLIDNEVKDQLFDLFLDFDLMRDQANRDMLLRELDGQLDQPLTVRRNSAARLDIHLIINACLERPGALAVLVRIIHRLHGKSRTLGEIERLTAEIERREALTREERRGLVELIRELPVDYVEIAGRGISVSVGRQPPQWSDPQQVVEFIVSVSESQRDWLCLLAFVDALAHLGGGRIGRELHGWADRLGQRLCFTQSEIRDLCLRSRNAADTGAEQNSPVSHASVDPPAPYAAAEDDEMRTSHEAPRTAPESRQELQRIWGGIPFRNPHFTGRESLLRRLRDELERHRKTSVLPQTLHGLGGVGKTQLAVEYIYRYSEHYDLVWWISAERRTDVLASLNDLGEELQVPPSEDKEQRARAVINALGTSPYHWLLVYDNADQPDEISPLVPSAGGHVLLTSRNADWTNKWRAIEVDVFDREESIELLHKRDVRIPQEAADRLADKLGDLPLALEQAINFQAATGMPVDEYLGLFDQRVNDLLDEGKPSDYHTTITAFLTLAFDRLREAAPAAAELLELFAFLGPESISASLLRNGRDGALSKALSKALRDSIKMGRMFRELPRYGLAKVDPKGGQRIQVHRLVQAVLRTELDEQRRTQSLTNVQNLLGAANPSRPDDEDTWSVHAELGPHVLPADLIHAGNPDARLVALDQARYLFVIGDYAASRDLGEIMVAAWSKSPEQGGLGQEHEQTLIASRHLANALRVLGDYDRARELDEEAFRRLRDSSEFGDDHEHTVHTALGLGFDRNMHNDLDGALQSDLENLARAERVYGPTDRVTLWARGNVVGSLRQLGRFREAFDLSLEIVTYCEDEFGAEHLDTLWAVSEQVRNLYGLGRYQEALDTQLRVWDVQARLTKPHQREYLLAERNIVIALRKSGDLAGALSRARDNYLAFHTHFRPDHEYTLAADMSYANALRAAGRLNEARGIGTDAVEGYKKKFGERHRLTLAAQVNLGIILRLLGERRAAHELERETFQALVEVLGAEHPYSLCAASNYANSLVLNHQVDTAHELTEQTLEVSRQVRGDEHPNTLACAVNVALDFQFTEGDQAAQQRLDDALDALERVLGRDHPDTIDAIRGKRADCDIESPPT